MVPLAGGRTRVVVAGPEAAEVVLFVPGMTYPLEVFASLSAAVVDAGRRSVRFDLYGRGRSCWDRTPLTTAVLAEQAAAVLDATCSGRRAHLVGLSNADILLMELGRRFPARVQSLTFLAPSGIDARTMNWRISLLSRFPLMSVLLQAALRRRCIRRMAKHRGRLPEDAPPWAADIYSTAIDTARSNPCFAEAVTSHLACLPTPQAFIVHARQLEQRPVPALMLTFAEEADATERGLTPLREALPSCREVAIARGSHMALLECPDSIVPHLMGFLHEVESSGSR